MLLEEETRPVNEGPTDKASYKQHDEEDDGTGFVSVSSGTSITQVSPETPLFKNNRDGLNDLTQLDQADSTTNNNMEDQSSSLGMPSLLNGPSYIQPLQAATPSHPQPQHHKQRESFLQDQFPLFDDDNDENPLTLEDNSDDSDHATTELSIEQCPLSSGILYDQHFSASGPAGTSNEEHPLLRNRHHHGSSGNDNKGKLFSKLHIPEKAAATPKAVHQKTKSILEEEMDYYPHPDDFADTTHTGVNPLNPTTSNTPSTLTADTILRFTPHYTVTRYLERISQVTMRAAHQYDSSGTAAATWIGFWALFLVTCANYVLMPMRDAIALAVGVQHIPKLTLASTVLAVFSSVPIGWLFEAPDPERRHMFKQFGLTRGETQGTSLALFYRFFALSLWSYAIGFLAMEFLAQVKGKVMTNNSSLPEGDEGFGLEAALVESWWLVAIVKTIMQHISKGMYIAFFLAVHLMKLHSLSLVWGVTTEAMEYEETARKRQLARYQEKQHMSPRRNLNEIQEQPPVTPPASSKMRLQRLAFVGFGGTVGGILGSVIASSLARVFRLSGLLVVSALMLEAAAQLAIELGRIMHMHWTQQQLFPSSDDLASLDPSMKRSASLGSMKRISSGNSLSRVRSMSELKRNNSSTSSSLQSLEQRQRELEAKLAEQEQAQAKEDTFSQRLLRGIRTILQSRLLMAIFTYNALYASTTTLLSFQRAELVANRNEETSNESNTAFLANINMASSVAVFALQASGVGAFVAHLCGSRGTLALMPLVRLMGVMTLAYWHQTSNGEPPNLLLFLVLDECCRVMNMAVAKPVRESLWRGLSNEARYEAKPIVDTLANRWGGGSAAFLVSSIHKLLDLFGVPAAQNGEIRVVFGFPPVLFLCMIVSAWWAGVSADLGQIRHRIDLELKKMQ